MTDANAFWSPDGTRLLFRSNRSGVNRVYEKRVNDNRAEELIDWGIRDEEMANMVISDYSRDGRHVILTNTGRATSFDVWRVTTAPSVEAVNVVATPFDEYHALLSPDGKWLAYVSNMSGAPQVYVLSFPEGDQRYQVSSQGGTEPKWRGDGRELFYLAGDQTLMAVSIRSQPDFKIGLPAPLLRMQVPLLANRYRQQYVATPDGQRFLVNTARAGTPPPAIHIISNWRALIERTQ